MNLWKNIATGSDDNIEIIGLDGVTVSQLRDHYNELGAEQFNAIYDRIKKGEATKADHEILKTYNLFLFDDPANNTQTSTSEVRSTGTGTNGYVGGTYPAETTYSSKPSATSTNLFTINPITKQISFNDSNLFALAQQQPIWLNDSFVSKYPQYKELLQYYPKGVMIFQDGSIYDAQDTNALNQNPVFQQFVLRNKETGGGTNDVIIQ